MLKLTLFRHAKSDWNATYKEDINRPLTARGYRAAKRMGEFLTEARQVPQLALTSPAVRARETLSLARRQGGWDCVTRIEPGLYQTDATQVMQILRDLENAADSVMLTGHEPTWSNLTAQLIGGPLNIKIPTGTMIRIDFKLDAWSDLTPGSGILRWMVPPKMLPHIEQPDLHD